MREVPRLIYTSRKLLSYFRRREFDAPDATRGPAITRRAEVAAFLYKIFHLIPVGDPDDILFNDGAIVERLGDVVAGGADQFHAALERRMVGTGADKGR